MEKSCFWGAFTWRGASIFYIECKIFPGMTESSSASSRTSRRYRVSGRVQGVGFRWFVQDRALALGIEGWVRNLPDGDVEVYAAGSEGSLRRLRADLEQGPPAARVSRCVESEVPLEPAAGFLIRR